MSTKTQLNVMITELEAECKRLRIALDEAQAGTTILSLMKTWCISYLQAEKLLRDLNEIKPSVSCASVRSHEARAELIRLYDIVCDEDRESIDRVLAL